MLIPAIHVPRPAARFRLLRGVEVAGPLVQPSRENAGPRECAFSSSRIPTVPPAVPAAVPSAGNGPGGPRSSFEARGRLGGWGSGTAAEESEYVKPANCR